MRISDDHCLSVAPLFVALGVAIGVGMLFRSKWALAFVVFERGFPLVRFLVFLPLILSLHRQVLTSEMSSTYEIFEILVSLFIVGYLVQTDVRHSFGFS